MGQSPNSFSIGVFDSGLGGLTVMQQLMKALPDEHFIYFGDTARLPYGEKGRETIIRYSIENTVFLLEKNIKALVVACNTATAHALERLQQIFSVPVIGVIDPGAESAVNISKNGRIAVLGTKGTIQSQSYQKAIAQKNPSVTLFPIACPLFVPLVEESYANHPAARLIVQEYLRPLKDQQIDTLLLGCTHYPLLHSIIQEEIGKDVAIIDSAVSCAKKLATILTENGLKRSDNLTPKHQYFVSDEPLKFQTLGQNFLNMAIDHVELARHAF